jgi:CheY-like chemotaxis protein
VELAGKALEALALETPDLLLSDIGMPGMDGYMLIRQIRAMPPEQGGQIRAIALSAYASKSDSLQALSAGFQKHLAKPVEPAQLIALVATLMGRSS